MHTLPKLLVVAVLLFSACKKSDDATETTTTATASTANLPAPYNKLYNVTQAYVDGNFLVIKSNALPDHKSPYYQGTAYASTKYEAYNGTGTFIQNPNSIVAQNLTYRIPMNPAVAAVHTATPGGPIGVAINGIPLFNQYAAGGAPLTGEIISFDQYGGHPQQQGQYHYHVEPLFLTNARGKDALMGFLLDGFPVYGPKEGAATLATADLDIYHGHFGITADYPSGIYHYHLTADAPYLNGSGFYGTAGTVTQ